MRTLALVVAFAASPAVAGTMDACAALKAALPQIAGGTPLKVSGTTTTYKSLYDRCDAENVFAGRPLPTRNGRKLRCSTDPNRVQSLVKYPDGTIEFTAKAAVDADGSKFACGSKWPNQCGTWLTFDKSSTRKDVNAEDTPFVVVPGKMPGTGISFQKDTRIGPGDLAVVLANGTCSLGVVGDSGPYFRLGEVSLRSQTDLGNPQCRVKGQYPCKSIVDRGLPSGVRYFIFPGTRPKPLLSQNVNAVAAEQGEKRLRKFLRSYAGRT